LNEEYVASFDASETFRTRLNDLHPMERTGTQEDVADMICLWASDAAAFVTGQVMVIDPWRISRNFSR